MLFKELLLQQQQMCIDFRTEGVQWMHGHGSSIWGSGFLGKTLLQESLTRVLQVDPRKRTFRRSSSLNFLTHLPVLASSFSTLFYVLQQVPYELWVLWVVFMICAWWYIGPYMIHSWSLYDTWYTVYDGIWANDSWWSWWIIKTGNTSSRTWRTYNVLMEKAMLLQQCYNGHEGQSLWTDLLLQEEKIASE